MRIVKAIPTLIIYHPVFYLTTCTFKMQVTPFAVFSEWPVLKLQGVALYDRSAKKFTLVYF